MFSFTVLLTMLLMSFTTAQTSNCLRSGHRPHLARSTLALFSPEASGQSIGTSVVKSQPRSRSWHDCVPPKKLQPLRTGTFPKEVIVVDAAHAASRDRVPIAFS